MPNQHFAIRNLWPAGMEINAIEVKGAIACRIAARDFHLGLAVDEFLLPFTIEE